MTQIKRAISDRAIAPDLPGITRFINEELKPLVRMLRSWVNAADAALPLTGYAQGSEPTVVGNAIVLNTTTGRPRFTADSGATWTDL